MGNTIGSHASVLVVGGCGFLGSHLVRYLLDVRRCKKVVVVDNLCVGKLTYLPTHDPRLHFVHQDITHGESRLSRILKDYNITHAFNYAAWPYIPDSFSRPIHVFEVNANGALNVINACHDHGIPILQVSSAELYGGATKSAVAIDEHYPVAPRSTYGAAKAAVDYYCQTAARERGTHVIALRQFNCVGERETHPYVIPEIIQQLQRCKERNLPYSIRLGNNSTRDFLYAGDAVAMAVELLEKGEPGGVYNLGSETSISIYALASLICQTCFNAVCTVQFDEIRARPWEIWYLQSNNTKIYETISYRPQVDLKTAVALTYKYYIEHSLGAWPW